MTYRLVEVTQQGMEHPNHFNIVRDEDEIVASLPLLYGTATAIVTELNDLLRKTCSCGEV